MKNYLSLEPPRAMGSYLGSQLNQYHFYAMLGMRVMPKIAKNYPNVPHINADISSKVILKH